MKLRSSTRHTLVPSVLLAAAGLFELFHDLVLGRTWNEMDYRWVVGFGIGLGALWLAGALGAALRLRWGFLTAVVASLALMGHGSVLRLGDAWVGAGYLVLGAASLFMLSLHARAFGFQMDPSDERTRSWLR